MSTAPFNLNQRVFHTDGRAGHIIGFRSADIAIVLWDGAAESTFTSVLNLKHEPAANVVKMPAPDPYAAVPQALKDLPRWITWSGDTKSKEPYISGTHTPASTTNPDHLASFDQATKNISEGRGYPHLGFVPTNGIIGLDIDSCRDSQTGAVQPWLNRFFQMLGPTYVEVTPSQSGLRAWVKAPFIDKKEVLHLRPEFKSVESKEAQIEPLAKNYGTVTGQRYKNAPSVVAEITEQKWNAIKEYVATLGPADQRDVGKTKIDVSPDGPPIPVGSQYNELLRIAGLLRNASMNPQDLEDHLIKVCERRCPGLTDNYKERCHNIAHGIGSKPVGSSPSNPVDAAKSLLDPENASNPSWISQHIPKANQLSTKPLTWVVENMILEHGLHIFSGKEGSMKSLTALMLAKSIVENKAFMERKSIDRPITVVYIDRENPEAEVRRRCLSLGLLDCEDFRVWGDWDPDNPPPLSFDDERLLECASKDDVLFIFDSLSSYLDGADENQTGEMMAIMGKARKLARACAGVIVLHHQPKSGLGSRGSSAIPASSDMAFVVEKNGNEVTLSEERFRACSGYIMKWELDFISTPDVYSYKVITNGLAGARGITESPDDVEDGRLFMTEATYIQRAKKEIEKAYALGKPLNQSQLATILGITGGSMKSRILCGGKDRPWQCIPAPGKARSVLFVPLEKKIEKKFEQEPFKPLVVDLGPPLQVTGAIVPLHNEEESEE